MLIIESDSPLIVWFSVILSWRCYIFHLRLSHLWRIFFLRHRVLKLDFVAEAAGIRNWVTQNLKKKQARSLAHIRILKNQNLFTKGLKSWSYITTFGVTETWFLRIAQILQFSLLEKSCSNQFGMKALPDRFLSQEESFTDRVSNKLKKVHIFLGGFFFLQNGDFLFCPYF